MVRSILLSAALIVPLAFVGVITRQGVPVPEATLAPVSAVADPPILGMNVHQMKGSAYELLGDLGISHVRNTIYLPLWETSRSYRSGKRTQAREARERGIHTMFVIHNAWGDVFSVKGNPERDRVKEEALRSMIAIAREIPEAEALQLWNEADVWVQAPFGTGDGESPFDVGRDYGEWFIGAYDALKAVNPDLLIVTAGTADHPAGRWEGFLQGMVSTPGFKADAVSIHAYGTWDRVREKVLTARRIVDPSGIPLWITEGGTSTKGDAWTVERHTTAWRSVIEGNQRERLAERFYPYCLETDPRQPGHGLFNLDGSARPIVDYLKQSRPANRG